MKPVPSVTIGMPVYNGERYVGRAIDSILAQTWSDFRLIILDNASNDDTGKIAIHYEQRDPRILYRRNERNLGAGPNFNKAFRLSDSPYFKWAAHDDELRPGYLEACVRALDADPLAVLAHSLVEEIDEVGQIGRTYAPISDQLACVDDLKRFRARVLERGWCTEIFAVIRAEKLLGTALIASFAPADLSLIGELALRGRFVIVPQPLFRSRVHGSRYTNAIFENRTGPGAARLREIMNWYDTSKRHGRWHLHWWAFLFALFRIISRNVSWGRRLPYYSVALRWVVKRENRRDLAKDLLFALVPSLHGVLSRASKPKIARAAGPLALREQEPVASAAPGKVRPRSGSANWF